MEPWKGKVAMVTGASSGIGYAVCTNLAQHGVIVLGLARRFDRLKELQMEIEGENGQFHPVKCDISLETEIQAAFDHAKEMFGGVDIMINNAGICNLTGVLDSDNMDSLKMVVDTNLLGVVSCTKKAFESMAERDAPGYIINVSSRYGRYVCNTPGSKPLTNLYSPTKFALTALVTVLRYELNYMQKLKIRISNISPGAVRTAIYPPGTIIPMLEPKDIADAVIYILGTNPRVQIEDFIIRPTGELN